MFMVDLAVPRDVELEVGELDDVFLYTVDDLAQVVESGIESRQSAVDEAETIVAARVDSFALAADARVRSSDSFAARRRPACAPS